MVNTENMLNPVKNASSIGTLLTGLGVIYLIILAFGISQGTATISGGILGLLLGFLPAVGFLAVGVGLRKTKKWAIWGLGILTLLILLPIIQGDRSWTQIALLIFVGGMFTWFLSAKNKFS